MENDGFEHIQLPYEEPEKPKLDFSNLHKALAQNPAPKQEYLPQGTINLPATTGADTGRLFGLFSNIDNLSDQDLFNLVSVTYEAVLACARPGSSREDIGTIWNLFNNVKYVMALSNVLGTVQMTYEQKICCN